jgi:hypothetical protein
MTSNNYEIESISIKNIGDRYIVSTDDYFRFKSDFNFKSSDIMRFIDFEMKTFAKDKAISAIEIYISKIV